jgi:5-hydroxyisourate hydrolase
MVGKTMSAITTHVLDTSRGLPAAGIRVGLEVRFPGRAWKPLGKGVTDADGRAKDLLPNDVKLTEGVYRLTFDNLPEGLYPEVAITFRVRDASRHYHIPLLLSPYGYTTYRGS